jgi:hypothetical protein
MTGVRGSRNLGRAVISPHNRKLGLKYSLINAIREHLLVQIEDLSGSLSRIHVRIRPHRSYHGFYFSNLGRKGRDRPVPLRQALQDGSRDNNAETCTLVRDHNPQFYDNSRMRTVGYNGLKTGGSSRYEDLVSAAKETDKRRDEDRDKRFEFIAKGRSDGREQVDGDIGEAGAFGIHLLGAAG